MRGLPNPSRSAASAFFLAAYSVSGEIFGRGFWGLRGAGDPRAEAEGLSVQPRNAGALLGVRRRDAYGDVMATMRGVGWGRALFWRLDDDCSGTSPPAGVS